MRFKILFLSGTCALSLLAQEDRYTRKSPPVFSDFPTSDHAPKRKAKLVLQGDDIHWRTRLQRGYTQKINFAGKFIITTWGCGAECLHGAALDTETGRVISLPGSVCCWYAFDEVKNNDPDPVSHSVNSNLIIFRGLINESGIQGTHYFKLENNKFVHLYTLPLPYAP